MTTEKFLTVRGWLGQASGEQREELCARAATSYGAQYQVATCRRNISVEKAARIEAATIAINLVDPTLPPVLRTSTCSVCAECPFARGGAV
jgi:hypothetical protein